MLIKRLPAGNAAGPAVQARNLDVVALANQAAQSVTTSSRRVEALVSAKFLVPRLPSHAIERTHLLELLHDGVRNRLFTVIGPGGYGKTTLVAQFAHEVMLPVCWYTLDASDAEPARFLINLVKSLRVQYPSFGRRLRLNFAFPVLPSAADLGGAIAAIADEITKQAQSLVVLVFDDHFQIDCAAEVNRLLMTLIEAGPDNLRVFILSRLWPRLIYPGRLFNDEQASGITIEDLRFTPDEVRQFQAAGTSVEHDRQIAPPRSPRGWPAALALGLKAADEILTVDGEVALDTFDLLADRLFEKLPSDSRSLLLRASIPATVSTDVLAALGGPTAQPVSEIDQHRLLVTELTDGQLRLHDLLRAYLQRKFRMVDPPGFRSSSRAYVRYLLQERHYADAIRVALDIGDRRRARRLLERYGDATLSQGQIQTLAELLAAATAGSDIAESPRLRLLSARTALVQHDIASAGALLDDNASAWPRLPRTYQAQLHLARAELANALDRPAEVLTHSHLALAQSSLPRVPRASLHRLAAMALLSQGNASAAADELAAAERLLRTVGDHASANRLLLMRATIARQRGDTRQSMTLLSAAEAQAAKTGAKAFRAAALALMGRTTSAAGDYQGAIHQLQHAVSLATETQDLRLKVRATRWIADIVRDVCSPKDSIPLYTAALDEAPDSGSTLHLLIGLIHAYRLANDPEHLQHALLMARGLDRQNKTLKLSSTLARAAAAVIEPDRALPLLRKSLRIAEQSENQQARVHALYLLALAALKTGRVKQSDKYLAEALTQSRRLGSTAFLVAEARWSPLLLEQAVERHVSPDIASDILARARAGNSLTRSSVQPATPLPSHIRIQTFGGFSAWRDGHRVAVHQLTRFARDLFVLLAERGTVRFDEALPLVFDDLPHRQGISALHNAIYQLHRTFGPTNVTNDGVRVTLSANHVSYDVARFRALVQARRWQGALRLYKGPFLPESTTAINAREGMDLAHVALMVASELVRDSATAEARGTIKTAAAVIAAAEGVLPVDDPGLRSLQGLLRELQERRALNHGA
ncbi:MAG: hypothetical protein KGJ86_08550 [Chloroflexota bacterium]|nr:hypothetical protein [Chloroflexota bacterium]